MMKRIAALALALLLVLTGVPAFGVSAAAEDGISCGEAARLLCENADAYGAVDEAEILGDEQADAALTNGAAAKMILRAFGELPEPHYLRVLLGYWDTQFEDVPKDCAQAVENLTRAGIYIPEDNTAFCPEDAVTRQALLQLLDRIHAYLGESLRDDFCNTVNHDLYYETETSMGEDLSWASNMIQFRTDEEAVAAWYIDVFNTAMESDGTDADLQNIAAFLSTWMDMEMRENAIRELEPYLRAIEEAQSAQALLDAFARISKELGVELFLQMDFNGDIVSPPIAYDEAHNSYYYFATPTVDSEGVQPGTMAYAYRLEQYARSLQEYGWEAERADAGVKAYLAYINEAAVQNETSDMDWDWVVRVEELDQALSNVSIADYMEKAGYPEMEELAFQDPGMSHALMALFDDDHLEALRTLGVYHLLSAFSSALPPRLFDRLLGFYDDYYATDAAFYQDYFALYLYAIPPLQWNMASVYARSQEGAKTKERVENLFSLSTDAYARMLSETDWLSDETKAYALEKLNAMGQYYVFPEQDYEDWKVVYLSAEEGGTLIGNIIRYKQSVRHAVDGFLSDAGDIDAEQIFCLGAMTDNAYYMGICNAFYIPLGSLLDGSLTNAETLEEQLATFGYTVGHEISHGFDNTGRYFDAEGYRNDWWTEEDATAYLERENAVAALYDGYEFAPGLAQSGETVVSEAIADNCGLCCMLNIAAQQESFDYDLFFRRIAKKEAFVTNRLSYLNVFIDDEHPSGRTRVNPLFANFDEFYETYTITETDNMYIPPEQRVCFWGKTNASAAQTDESGFSLWWAAVPVAVLAAIGLAAALVIRKKKKA